MYPLAFSGTSALKEHSEDLNPPSEAYYLQFCRDLWAFLQMTKSSIVMIGINKSKLCRYMYPVNNESSI